MIYNVSIAVKVDIYTILISSALEKYEKGFSY